MPPLPASAARRAVAVLALGALAACGGSERADRQPGGDARAAGGTLVIATVGDATGLLPPLVGSIQGAQVVEQLFDRLADVGDSLQTIGDAGFRPRLARGWRWSADSLSIAFALDPRARWHDGRPVTARDVRFTHAVYIDPAVASPVAPLLANVDSVSAPDSLTAVFWFRRRTPEQFFDATYQMFVLPEHLLGREPRAALARAAFARQPVGSGRFRFAGWTPGQSIALVADTGNYRGRPGLDRVLWSVNADPNAATLRLLAGEADLWEQLRGDAVGRVAASPTLRTLPYASLDLGYLAFNLRAPDGSGGAHPLLADRALRRALAAAVDRAAVVRNVFDTLAAPTSVPVPRAVLGWTPTPLGPSFDPARARAELEALGWRDADGDGIRERGGRPLAFRLLVPTTSAVRGRLAVLLQAQWRAVGARVDVDAADPARFGESAARGRYDAQLAAWHADPSPTAIRQQWGASGIRSGTNVSGYASPAFDALVDSAASTFDRGRAAALYGRAYALLAADVPAIWLYEPRNLAGVHRRLQPAGLRADAWWAGLAEWRIPPGERIARDRAGLGR